MVLCRRAALAILLASSATTSVFSFQGKTNTFNTQNIQNSVSRTRRRPMVITKDKLNITPTKSLLTSMAADASSSFNNDNDANIGEALSSVTNAAVDSIANAVKDEPDKDAEEIARKYELYQKRQTENFYKVTLPLAPVSSSNLGIRICQVSNERTLNNILELDLDTLDLKESNLSGSDPVTSTLQERIDGGFQGLVVSSVVEDSAGWVAGVKPGDILKTTSATLGNQLWPKSTLDGVKSAITSRKAVSESMDFEFQRTVEAVDNTFELTLTRPIGFNLKETVDGYVEVIGFTPKASKLARYAVQVGDRILAVDSSLGDRMWPVSTTEGLISAVTSRLPGQKITFRFQRNSAQKSNADPNMITGTAETNGVGAEESTSTNGSFFGDNATTASNTLSSSIGSAVAEAVSSAPVSGMDFELLDRCQDIMRRYKNDEKYVNKFALPGVVADKVVYALASAETKVDSVTLSMVMTAYLKCRKPEMAIRSFEAIVGLRADGIEGNADKVETISNMDLESNPLLGKDGKLIVPNTDALDVYTAGALMKAHAMMGDLVAVQRVLSVLEGHGGATVEDVEIASWPGTGPSGFLKPDSLCYNVAITAAANSDAEEGLEMAMIMFNKMSNPGKNQFLVKDVVSYNAVIKALTKFGEFEEAIDLFYKMKKTGVKPDKYTYTALAKAIIVDDNDLEELLYDMRDQGVSADVKTFNTIIRYLCEQKKISAARKVVTFMESTGVTPDSWTYGFLMQGLLDSGKASAALTLFESACSDRRTVGLTENVYLYTSAMTAAASIGDHTRALELLSRMNSLGIKPNIKTMTALLSACLSAGEPELAVDIFRRIPNPDTYAVTKGLLALSLAGKGDEALDMLSERGTVAGTIQGKPLNRVYESLVTDAIHNDDFGLARRIMKSLMGKGNIPSKPLFQRIFESLGLTLKNGLVTNLSYTENGFVKRRSLDDLEVEKFKFLLFLVDLLSDRNLPCEAPLYSTILQFGNHCGGLPRKVSAMLVSAKAASGVYTNSNLKLLDEEGECDTESQSQCPISGWEDLFLSFDDVRSRIESPLSLPKLEVRIASRELSRVLRAERNLSFRKRRSV